MNLYCYVGNGPIGHMDPLGLILGSTILQRIQKYGNKLCALGLMSCKVCCGLSATAGGLGATIEFATAVGICGTAGVVAVGGAVTVIGGVAVGLFAVGCLVDAHISFIDALKSLSSDYNDCMEKCKRKRCEKE